MDVTLTTTRQLGTLERPIEETVTLTLSVGEVVELVSADLNGSEISDPDHAALLYADTSNLSRAWDRVERDARDKASEVRVVVLVDGREVLCGPFPRAEAERRIAVAAEQGIVGWIEGERQGRRVA